MGTCADSEIDALQQTGGEIADGSCSPQELADFNLKELTECLKQHASQLNAIHWNLDYCTLT